MGKLEGGNKILEGGKDEAKIQQTVQQLREAHAVWKSKSEEKPGIFNGNWLREHGYVKLAKWMQRFGGLKRYIELAGGEVAEDYEKGRFKYNPELAIAKLKLAHAEWRAIPESERGAFNTTWIQNNSSGSLDKWMREHGGVKHYITLAGGEVAKDFEVSSDRNRTPESVIAEFRRAHLAWKALPEAERGVFNSKWLDDHGYGRLAGWMQKYGGAQHFANLAGGEVAENFEVSYTRNRTPESVVIELRLAHAAWKVLPEAERGSFNATWLSKNYSGLNAWMKTNGGAQHFANLAGGEVAEDFEVGYVNHNFTPEIAITKLRDAHIYWKTRSEEKKEEFNSTWLEENGYPSIVNWMRTHGGVLHFVRLAGEEIEQDFEISNIGRYTPELAIAELKKAHATWKISSKNKQWPFNSKWLRKNKYGGLRNWMLQNGGVLHFVRLAGEEIEQDFEYRDILKEKAIKQKLVDTVTELAKQGPEGKEFQNLISIFGASRCADILFKFRPEFKGLPVEYIKSTIAEYLGDFLVLKGSYNSQIEFPVEYLSDISLQEGLYETIKDNCLRYYYEQRKVGRTDSYEIIYGYLDHIIEQVGHLNSQLLDDIIQKVVLYYDSVLRDFHKPEQFVDELSAAREFPDINQRINMKELADKKRLLIGDEMGMGKSASVIMAKEQLGVKCAVVVAPANVIHTRTWQKYLSDYRAEGGYYKNGKAPRVLVVDSIQNLKGVIAQDYDFILISQERMDEEHTALLEQIDYDMLIIDEVHKVKAIEGKRAANVVKLAEKIQGENKYVALLSGTPVPNKVEDIAMVLKMLYPDKFSNYSSKVLVSQIINGDVIDLRALLLPRMQMKSLEESVEMPELKEKTLLVELSQYEQEIYEVLLEEDELNAMEKMTLLRRFLLNPEIIDPTPGIDSAKITELSKSLQIAFQKKNKIVVFVNGYIEGVLRGDKTIVSKLGLPAFIDVRVVDGSTSKVARAVTQKEFNNSSHKMLLLVSGDTADVGVDFSAGEKIIFYNDPWTQYQKKQELGRVFRPGLKHDLETETFVTKGTIEQGISEYILRKYKAVEKLLRGVPITELEKELLIQDEASKDEGPDQSVNPELAEYYFSSWDTLLRMFSYIKEIGQDKFKEFLSKYGEEYANCYLDLGNRSYQANANRVAAAVIRRDFEAKGLINADKVRILDLASGPEMLKQHIADELQDRVISMDINQEHFKKTEGSTRVVGSLLQTPFLSNSFDYVNLSLALQYTDFAPSKGRYARLESLMEVGRVLKIGGKGVMSLIYSMELGDRARFAEVMDLIGLKVIEESSGVVEAGSVYASQLVTVEKVQEIGVDLSVEDLVEMMSKDQIDSLKFVKNKKRIRDSRQIITNFHLHGQEIEIKLNSQDKKVLEEEQSIKKLGQELKNKFGSISAIPRSEVVNNGFVRFRLADERYILFKKLVAGSGAVIIR